MIFKQQQPQNAESARLKYQSDSLRKQFLSQLIVQPSSSNTSQSQQNKISSKRKANHRAINAERMDRNQSSSQVEGDRDEQKSSESEGNEEDIESAQDLENNGKQVSNIDNSSSGDQFMYNKETCIVRNSKNWKDLQIALDSSQQQEQPNLMSNLLKSEQSHTKILAKSPKNTHIIPDQPTMSKKSLAACSSTTPHSTIQLTNYRTMLKNQIKKSRNLEQQLSKQNHRNNLLMELVKKLKQENQMLIKFVKKSTNGNQVSNCKKKKDKTINIRSGM